MGELTEPWDSIAHAVGFTAHWSIRTPTGFGPGFALWISWLYPIAIDWYAVVVTRLWLKARRGSRVAGWAKANSIGAVALAVASQGVYHAMIALHWQVGQAWLFVVVVGGIPPVLVGLVAHLYYELANERVEAEAAGQPDVLLPEPVAEPQAVPEPRPAAPRKANRKCPRTEPARTEPVGNVVPIDRRTDEQVTAEVRQFVRDHLNRTGRPPGRHLLAKEVRVGYARTRELIDNAVAELAVSA